LSDAFSAPPQFILLNKIHGGDDYLLRGRLNRWLTERRLVDLVAILSVLGGHLGDHHWSAVHRLEDKRMGGILTD
jgi:hypothetical protein